ncbi:MAG: DUF4097 family beta strand repeat protein [Candidatus Syntrophosphaera sp.]|nr:DUF4097 family beta strand repeat protein [Candidatus Syntrophosphaera sp.]
MKTQKIKLDYDFADVQKVKIVNNMSTLRIGASESGKIEIEAALSLQEPYEDKNFEDYFHVHRSGQVVEIELEEIEDLKEPFFGTGRSPVWIRVPAADDVEAETDNLAISAEGLNNNLEIHNENGPIMVSQCSGFMHLENKNGPVKVHNCQGDLTVKLENGPLSAEKIGGELLKVESENGPIKIRLAGYHKVDISNENGVIYFETLPVENGEFHFENENGVVHLVLPEDFDFELDAETEAGILTSNFEAEHSSGEGHKIIRRGEGLNKIRVKTENGVIKLSSGGRSDLGFIMLKIGEMKDTINKAVKPEDKEKLEKILESVTATVEKAIGSITEEKVKNTLTSSLDKLKATIENFDVQETKDKVVSNVDQIGNEVADALKVIIRKVKEPFGEGGGESSHLRRDMDLMKDHINKVIENAFAKAGSKGMSGKERDEVDERSRVKILEMLESGKITAEEAERLLKAISKE